MKCILPRTRKPLGQRVTSAVFTAVPVASALVGVGVARAEDPGVASWAVAVTDYRGNAVEAHAIPLADHITAAALGGNAALDRLGRRPAGQPAPGNCTS